MYESKDAQYFSFVRRDIAPLLPADCGRVLELGCGGGGTLAWLKSAGRAAHTTGVELCAGPAAAARTRVDRVIEGDLDEALETLPREAFDLVLCLDVLEHLVDPWDAVRRARNLLRPGGSLVVSLPNVRHHSVVLPLLFKGSWRYRDAGIMDRTHLRFFSRDGARELLTQGGLRLAASIDSGIQRTRRRDAWKGLLSLTPLRDLAVFQFLLRAERPLAESERVAALQGAQPLAA